MNLELMIGATNARLPKYATNTMSFEEMKPIPPPHRKWGEKSNGTPKRLVGNPTILRLKDTQKL